VGSIAVTVLLYYNIKISGFNFKIAYSLFLACDLEGVNHILGFTQLRENVF